MKEMIGLLEQHLTELEQIDRNGLIRFKQGRERHPDLKTEYLRCDNRLRFIFNSYSAAIYMKFEYKPMIAVIERTHEEQDLIYGNDPAYQKQKWMSTHQTNPCRAIDLRDYDMTPEQIKFTLEYFEQVIYTTPNKNTIIRHNVGLGSHFHLQVDWDMHTEIKRV